MPLVPPTALMPLAAGRLRHRVTVQSLPLPPAAATNAYGEVTSGWTNVATHWAEIVPLSGRELWQAQEVHPDVTHQVTMRYLAALAGAGGPKMRLSYQGRVFQILSVLTTLEIHRDMVLLCKEEV